MIGEGTAVLIDTHAHVNDAQFDADRDAVLARAREAGVARMIIVGYNRATIPSALALADRHEDLFAAIGWHPHDAAACTEEDLAWVQRLAREHGKVVAIGEIGLDYYRDGAPRDTQQAVFRRQLTLARHLGLPVIIHCRDAYADVLEVLREEGADEIGGVMHCFTADWETAKAFLDLGFYLGIGGVVTFKSGEAVREVAQKAPLDRLLLETDCPYLAPVPHRGKRNEPAYLRHTAEVVASVRSISVEELAAATTENAARLFHLP
ncbi:TatD family hydrolase [Calditerricola yamamurae]|jgi:hydrolase, TatD family